MFPLRVFVRFCGTSFAKKCLKGYKFAEISPADCEEQHVRGWGPGGSCVNSAGNAVILKHKKTNCVVRVHESRKLYENIQIAYKRLKLVVDRHLNGDDSYEAQFEHLKKKYEEKTQRTKEKRRAQAEEFRKMGEEMQRKEKAKTNRRGEKEEEEEKTDIF